MKKSELRKMIQEEIMNETKTLTSKSFTKLVAKFKKNYEKDVAKFQDSIQYVSSFPGRLDLSYSFEDDDNAAEAKKLREDCDAIVAELQKVAKKLNKLEWPG